MLWDLAEAIDNEHANVAEQLMQKDATAEARVHFLEDTQ